MPPETTAVFVFDIGGFGDYVCQRLGDFRVEAAANPAGAVELDVFTALFLTVSSDPRLEAFDPVRHGGAVLALDHKVGKLLLGKDAEDWTRRYPPSFLKGLL